jgi:hypothetical protein
MRKFEVGQTYYARFNEDVPCKVISRTASFITVEVGHVGVQQTKRIGVKPSANGATAEIARPFGNYRCAPVMFA